MAALVVAENPIVTDISVVEDTPVVADITVVADTPTADADAATAATSNGTVDDAKDEKPAMEKTEIQKKNVIQVSNTKKPFFFYLNLSKRYMKQHNEVELSALGMAIPTVVLIAEILKKNGWAIEKRVRISTIGSKDESKGRLLQKAKISILLEKTENANFLKNSAAGSDAAVTPEDSADEKQCQTSDGI